MATHVVFYSWHSDRPNSTNRGFIQDCLERAIKEIRADDQLSLEPCLDRDTAGTTGARDIAATIFDKIRQADVFVGDVTFIDRWFDRWFAMIVRYFADLLRRQRTPARRVPNPNVLVELGYAAACLKWEKVICVFNLAFGRLEDLPFDIRSRRVLTYRLKKGQEKADVRKQLVAALKEEIAAHCGSRWADVHITGSFLTNVQTGEVGIGFEVTNTGGEELPPYKIAIVHPTGCTFFIFPSEKSGALRRDQKREHRCTLICPGDPRFFIPTFTTGIDGAQLTAQDDAQFVFRLVLEDSKKVLYENHRLARAFAKVARLIIGSGGKDAGTGTDWLELDSSLPDE